MNVNKISYEARKNKPLLYLMAVIVVAIVASIIIYQNQTIQVTSTTTGSHTTGNQTQNTTAPPALNYTQIYRAYASNTSSLPSLISILGSNFTQPHSLNVTYTGTAMVHYLGETWPSEFVINYQKYLNDSRIAINGTLYLFYSQPFSYTYIYANRNYTCYLNTTIRSANYGNNVCRAGISANGTLLEPFFSRIAAISKMNITSVSNSSFNGEDCLNVSGYLTLYIAQADQNVNFNACVLNNTIPLYLHARLNGSKFNATFYFAEKRLGAASQNSIVTLPLPITNGTVIPVAANAALSSIFIDNMTGYEKLVAFMNSKINSTAVLDANYTVANQPFAYFRLKKYYYNLSYGYINNTQGSITLYLAGQVTGTGAGKQIVYNGLLCSSVTSIQPYAYDCSLQATPYPYDLLYEQTHISDGGGGGNPALANITIRNMGQRSFGGQPCTLLYGTGTALVLLAGSASHPYDLENLSITACISDKYYIPLNLTESVGGTMDTPLILTLNVKPEEVDDEVHAMEVVDSYPLRFYEKTFASATPSEVTIELVENRLKQKAIFDNIRFTHESSALAVQSAPKKSLYVQLKTMQEKVDAEFGLMDRIYAVNKKDAARRVITSHFIPDLIGNLHSFSKQIFRCSSCNAKYRRVPLAGKCTRDGGKLLLTISKGGIEKYLDLAIRIADRYDLDPYIKQRLYLVRGEINDVFAGTEILGTATEGQFSLVKYF